ncbi:MAG TPA: HAMP domain-containing sensor histidine kinase [Gemmatimonadaceae bacterium]|nr:HAMP domain-containing sensor histidine kinase [Gemmatimonadaceae bacterium]
MIGPRTSAQEPGNAEVPLKQDDVAAPALPDALSEALAHATALAMRELVTVAQSPHHDADLRDSVAWVSDAVRLAATVAGAEPRSHPPAPAPLALDTLRTCLLSELIAAGDQVNGTGILRLLSAVERVHQIIEHDDAHRFSARLAGPGGLELLVEVGHDLRSPLASILFLAETLRKGQSGEVNTVQERQLGLIYSAAFGLSTVASDVIAFARGGDRLIDPTAEAFSVLAILRSVQDIVLPMAEEKGLAVLLEPPDADFRVGHPGALNRVLLNLTTNALKFTSNGHVEIAVTAPTRSRLAFSVRDTGRGIPPQVMTSLFDPFRRRDPGDHVFSSAGLGLSICRKLVSAMGGVLGVETSEMNGTRFFFELELPVVTRL